MVCVYDSLPADRRTGARPQDLAPKLLDPERRAAFFATFVPLEPQSRAVVQRSAIRLDADRLAALRDALARIQSRKVDPMVAITKRVRGLVSNSLVRRGYRKGSLTECIIGCSFAQFAKHIERQFLPGMTWENRRLWHVDHITPLATAETEVDVIALNHFTNLRPLWAADNLAKSDTVTHLI